MSGALVLALVELEDVSVSSEEYHVLVTCSGHNGTSTIEIEDAHTKIAQAGYRIRKTEVNVSPDGRADVQFEVVE